MLQACFLVLQPPMWPMRSQYHSSSHSSLWKLFFSLWSEIPWCLGLVCSRVHSLIRVFGSIWALQFLVNFIFGSFPPYFLCSNSGISVSQMLNPFWWFSKSVFVFKLYFGGKTSLIVFSNHFIEYLF